jgi:hypothetical protein
MKLLKKHMILLSTLMVSGIVMAGHHEKGEAITPAASAGQIMMMYHWPCADNDEGMSSLKGLIAYERDASPYKYSAAPAVHEDGALVSVDVHPSSESMDKALAWQEADEVWQSMFAEMAEACGSADDITVTVLTMQ